MSDDLVDFLRARLDAIQRREEGQRSISGNLGFDWTQYGGDDDYVLIGKDERVPVDEFYERYGESAADPQVLADVDAKRRIVDGIADADPHGAHITGMFTAWDVLRLLALPFADHPDYQPEWRPS
ncbi:DUF6221 family protein [Streptomyces sp. NBC_00237]|uniref:DUF6221 family protein n=1 Tax=Streptomyces sp. NBC_00237 TaxID=2975687 RepID=UPI002254E9FE|nr:DUF6221 family protein [Streptomyces sp. NBC_00237]MCX5202510.1 DUF6221 family protein [Streptomyces sp. NBC_00237]